MAAELTFLLLWSTIIIRIGFSILSVLLIREFNPSLITLIFPMKKSIKRRATQMTYSGSIAQILALGFAASVLLTVLSFFSWVYLVGKPGFPIEAILIVNVLALFVVGLILLAIKKTERWSHLAVFGTLFGALALVTVFLVYVSAQASKKEYVDIDSKQLFLSSLDAYLKSANICLAQFEKVTNKDTAEQAISMLNQELSSLGGTVRSFAWYQDDKDTSDLVGEIETKVQGMNKRLKIAVEKARQNAGDQESFKEVCDRYLALVSRIERKEHLKHR